MLLKAVVLSGKKQVVVILQFKMDKIQNEL